MSKEWKSQQTTITPTKTTSIEEAPFDQWVKDIMCAMIVAKTTTTGDEALINKAVSTTEALCSKLSERRSKDS